MTILSDIDIKNSIENNNLGIDLKGTLEDTQKGFRVVIEGTNEEVEQEENKMIQAYSMVLQDNLKEEKNKRIIRQFFSKFTAHAKATAILYYKLMGVNIGHYIDGKSKEIKDIKPEKSLEEKMMSR